MEIQHVAIEVSDLEETKTFYEDGLGLKYDWDFHTDEGVHNYYVTGNDLDTWIQFVHDPNSNEEIEPAGFAHNAILVENVDTTFDRVVSDTDCTVVEPPKTVEKAEARVAFIKDPDGYEIEIYQSID